MREGGREGGREGAGETNNSQLNKTKLRNKLTLFLLISFHSILGFIKFEMCFYFSHSCGSSFGVIENFDQTTRSINDLCFFLFYTNSHRAFKNQQNIFTFE
jgi:hypothetical protein